MLSDDMVQEAIPGNIRKAEHFVAFLKRFVEYMKVSLQPFKRSVKKANEKGIDTNASSACGSGNASVVLAASEGYHVY